MICGYSDRLGALEDAEPPEMLLDELPEDEPPFDLLDEPPEDEPPLDLLDEPPLERLEPPEDEPLLRLDELPEDFLADDDEEPVEFELVFGDVPELDFVVPDEGDFDDDDDDDEVLFAAARASSAAFFFSLHSSSFVFAFSAISFILSAAL